MARTDKLSNYLTDVASAIKEKKGDTTPILASEFDTEILNLPKGDDVSNYIDLSLINGYKTANYLVIRLITRLPYMDTSEVQNMSYMFSRFSELNNLQELDCSKANNVSTMFASCTALETFGGLKDLGKAFLTTASANYANYTLNLVNTILSHDSLMNVLNKVYDIASLGVQTQKIQLSSSLLNKLTAEEIAIATNKGWTVST